MSDGTKIVLAVMGVGLLLVVVVTLASSGPSAPQPEFTPGTPGPTLPATDASAEAVRGGFNFAGQLTGLIFNHVERQADRDAAAEQRQSGDRKSDSGNVSYSPTELAQQFRDKIGAVTSR